MRAVDEKGSFVPNANQKVKISVEKGEVVGCSNGDPTSHNADISATIDLFSGRCQYILHTDINEKPVYSVSII